MAKLSYEQFVKLQEQDKRASQNNARYTPVSTVRTDGGNVVSDTPWNRLSYDEYVTLRKRGVSSTDINSLALEAARNQRAETAEQSAWGLNALKSDSTATQPIYKAEDMNFGSRLLDRILGVDRTKVTGGKTDWGQLAIGAIRKGANQWNALNWETADMLLGGIAQKFHETDFAEDLRAITQQTYNGFVDALNYIPGVNLDYAQDHDTNFITRMTQQAKAGRENMNNLYSANANTSRAAQIIDTFGTSTIAAVPMALEAWLLAPAQAAQAGAATTQGLSYFSGLQAAKGAEATGMMLRHGLKEMVKNPQFWTSYVQVAGDGYESALADGMSETDAKMYGLVNGFFNAMIEIGGADEALGGIQNLPMRLEQTGGKNALVEWFKQAVIGEGREEVLQGISERGGKSLFGQDVPLYSLDPGDNRAVFNPYTAAQEFTGGAVVGGLLGGGQAAASQIAQRGIDAAQNAQREKLNTGLQAFFQENVRGANGEALPQAIAEQLAGEYDLNPDAGSAEYAYGMKEAYDYGARGESLAEAKGRASFSDVLTDTSFEHAWRMGALSRVGGENENAGAVKNDVRAHLAHYGEEAANRLAELHDGTTTAEEYAKLVDLGMFYASHGADLATVAEETRSGLIQAQWTQDKQLAKLTPEQISAIQELGPKIDAERRARVDRAAKAFEKLRENPGGSLAQINKQLDEARKGLEGARSELQSAEAEMRQMQDSGAWSTEEAAYNAVVQRVEGLDTVIESGEKLVRDLEAQRAQAQQAMPQKRKKGTVSFDESVDQKSLTRQQKKNVAAVQALADAVNIDYILYSGEEHQGGYYVDGQMYINLNAALPVTQGGEKTKMSIFGFTVSHELTHHLKAYAPKEYEALRDFIVGRIKAEKGEKGFSALVQEQIHMERKEKKLSYDQAVDEVVANSCITMLRDSKVVKEIARKHMTTAERIVDFLEDFVGKLKAAFEGEDFHGDNRLFNAAKALENDAEDALKLWEEALKASDVNYNAAQDAGKLSPMTGSEVQAMAWEIDTEYDFGVSQYDINAYVENAYAESNTEDYKKYAEVSERLAEDVESDIPDIRNYTHAMRDNDIRHVRNSHGEKTREKYPVTENDQKLIPYIVANYDKVLAKNVETGKPGIVYVKVMDNNLVYYVEAVTEAYGNEKLLVNKQMVKTGLNDIPHLSGLAAAITKKQTKSEFLADLNEIHKAYARSVYQTGTVSDNSVPNKAAPVKENSEQFMAWDGVEERAVEHFGTTEDFRIAGYILADGNMLDFSGAHWLEGYDERYVADWRKKNDIRQVDHEDIYEAFGDAGLSDSSLAFIRRGNIRIAPEAPGLEMFTGKEPTAQQYAQIREFVREINDNPNKYPQGHLWIDLTTSRKERGRMTYTGEIRPDRVVNDLRHYYKTGEIREQGTSAWFMTWDDQVSFEDVMDENAQMSMDDLEDVTMPGEGQEKWRKPTGVPDIDHIPKERGPRRERALAAVLTKEAKRLLTGYLPEGWDERVTEADIEDWMDADEYHGVAGNLFYDGMQVADLLYELAQTQPEKTEAAYFLMEQITGTMNPVYAQAYTLSDGNTRAPGFAEWYSERNPSLYYPGYKPGDLFWNENQWEFEEDVHRNLLNEIEYLSGLIDDGNISEETKEDARRFLERLTGRTEKWSKPYDGGLREYQEIFYMSWDDDHNDWAPEFYSKLNRTVTEWANDKGKPMPEKMAAGAVIPWLRGRGVKAEEIRWSGLQPWLEGRKSVTKEELAAYLAGNMIDIRTEVRGRDMPEYQYEVRYDPFQVAGGRLRDEFELNEAIDRIEDILSEREGKQVYAKAQVNDYGIALYYEKPNGEKESVLRATMNDAIDSTKWSDYTLKGGYRYREILFYLPGNNYDNQSMRVHWERSGVLAHARVQDMEEVSEGKRVLFIEELQSDWHNEGAKKNKETKQPVGFNENADIETINRIADLKRESGRIQFEGPVDTDIYNFINSMTDRIHKADKAHKYSFRVTSGTVSDWVNRGGDIANGFFLPEEEAKAINKEVEDVALSLMTEQEKDLLKQTRETYAAVKRIGAEISALRSGLDARPPDVPFAGSADTHHEYVMKHLLRLAAEGDYDAIGWTTAEQQAERWNNPDEAEMEQASKAYQIEYDQTIPSFMKKYTKQWGGKVGDMALAVPYSNGQETRVWSVDITPEMKKAVLHEGQPLFMSWDGAEDTEQEWQARLEAYSRLEAEQAIQEQMFQSIRELTRSQKRSLAEIQKRLKIGRTPEARMDDVQRTARALIAKYNSTLKEEDLAAEIAHIWNYVLQDTDPSGTVVRNMAEELAEKIAYSARLTVEDETEAETLKEIRDRIKGGKLAMTGNEGGDIPGYSSLSEFQKKNFGRFSVVGSESSARTAAHVPVDSFYEELRGSYGDYYFPELTNQGEMLGVLSGYFDAAAPQTVNPFEDSFGEAVESIAGEIVRSAWWDAVRITPMTEGEQRQLRNVEARERIQELRDERKITKKEAGTLEAPIESEEALYEQNAALQTRIKELVEAGEISKAEAAGLQADLLRMTRRAASLEDQYDLLEKDAEKRVAQAREEGAAKAAEKIAKIQERNAKNVQALKDHFREVQQNARARREESGNVKKYRKQIAQQVETLRKWMMSPSNKNILHHVPAEIQKTVADFLESISLVSQTYLRTGGQQTTRADDRCLKSMKRMRDAIRANVNAQGQYSGYNDLPPDFLENFERMIERTEAFIKDNPDGFVVNRMTGAELRELRDTLKILKKYITEMNEFHNNAMFQHAYEAGDETIAYLTQFAKSRKSGLPYRFLRFDYMRPSYAFEHFGKGGQSIEREFREGQAIQAFLAKKIIAFAEETYGPKEVKSWSEEVKTFELSDGETVSVPVTHLMSLYCLNKREQARLHIYGDGIRIANFRNGKETELDEGHLVSIPDVQRMIGALTERQKEVADKLQKYMSTEAAKWGNHVSMARFDVEQFTEENYFPINSDGRYLSTTADESPDNAGLYALLNSGFTKELKENARNRIILYNIFDVFANHTASMAQYRAFALPMLDALKWFNYKDPDTSVRTKLSSAFGAPLDERAGSGAKGYAEQFVINLLKAYNGTSAQGDPYDTTALKMLHRFNGAAIAFNLRVIIQQPTAIARAAMILSPGKLAKGLGVSVAQMRKLADEMEAHSGIAAWKSLGFYDTNISRGLTDLIKQNPGILDRVMDFGTKGAEMADRFTWAAMWHAAKSSVRRSDYASEEEYYKAVTDLFEEVIYKTQVVDSLLTKAEFLRSKGAIARQLGSFMSEPSATMSMLTDAYYKYTDDLQRGVSRSEAWRRNGANIGKTMAVYAVGQVILSAMQAVIDAWRDDDEYDPDSWLNNYIQKYLKAFKGNLVEEELIFGKIPVVSELYDLMKNYLDKFGVFDKLGLDLYGNEVTSGIAMYTKYLSKAVEIIAGKFNGDSKYNNYTNYSIVYNLLRFASNVSGIPFGTAWREIQDIWNNTVGFLVPSKKLVTYERSLDRTYEEHIRSSGMSKKQYEKILDAADSDGGIAPTQDELGAYLTEALSKGELTEEQANALWTSRWNKANSTTFEGWRSKNGGAPKAETAEEKPATGTQSASAQKAASTQSTGTQKAAKTETKPAAPEDPYKSFSKNAPIYGGDKKKATYAVWENQLKGSMSLERFEQILKAADVDGNSSLKQAELGSALLGAVRYGEMSDSQAAAVWAAQGWDAKHDWNWYKAKH